MREDRTEVLMVGAGPVGLWTALLLAEAGVEVAVIDREERTAARSYACALHPHTLAMLERLGLAARALELGRRVPMVAFYDGESRRAELNLAGLGGDFPFLLVLPQNALERLLEQRLAKAGVAVNWNHRFDAVQEEVEGLNVTVEELGGTSTGYIVPHWETVVKARRSLRAQFLVGADGHDSTVRRRLGIEMERAAPPEHYAAYEFEAAAPLADEVRLVLDDSSTNVLWPLVGNQGRWTFQMSHSQSPPELPEKERRSVRLVQPVIDERIRQYVQTIAHRRAPWFSADVKQITWCSEVVFQPRLARQFGRARCWLAGDAAHQTGPAGVQSMNVGFSEGAALAEGLRQALRNSGGPSHLRAYDSQWRQEWRRLLGLSGGLKAGADTDRWLRQRAGRLLPCLPASGGELTRLAELLKFALA